MNRAPKFSKIELVIKDLTKKDKAIVSTEKLEFLDSGLMITGDYLIVVIDERNELDNTLTSTGKVFNMNQVVAYKTHSI
jgi:hypothetical protein